MIKVLKFGGASIKDIESINNVLKILQTYREDNIVVVFSAIGKVTNMLEKLIDLYVSKSPLVSQQLDNVKQVHYSIIKKFFKDDDEIYNIVDNLFVEIEWVLEDEPNIDFSYDYDQIVSVGELLSSNIMSSFLKMNNFHNSLLDARDIIKTDNQYQHAKIDWTLTEILVKEKVISFPVITQGFIGCTSENFTTTLGREGSDYTSAVLAYALDAKILIIWKDVKGVLNADPRFFDKTKLLENISFTEAIELAFYGAKVIHPKTIQPLQKKGIPLQVRSFIDKNNQGTLINNINCSNNTPSYIVKENQVLISISDNDLSFIIEKHLSWIFSLLSKYNIRLNLMQNSAVSFSICIDNDKYKLPKLIDDLSKRFSVYYNDNLTLYTIRHYTKSSIDFITNAKSILLEQKSRNTVQFVIS
jgi:aspartate kinase|tara:strand:- start:15583 stop:16827 length:1245 start_codon:yes stop_codon:yes gene_type:complete